MDWTSGEAETEAEGRLADRPASDAADAELVSRSRELEDVSFGAIAAADGDVDTPAAPDADRTEDAHARVQWATPDGLELVGRGIAARFVATGPTRFAEIRDRAGRAFDALEHDGPDVARPRAVGGFAFHDRHTGDRSDDDSTLEPSWDEFDAASFVIPRVFVVRNGEGTWLTTVGADAAEADARLERWHDRIADLPAMQPSGTGPGVAATRRTTSPDEWRAGIETALERIATGDLTKVVLAQALSVELEGPIDVGATLERLRREYPNCYRFRIGREGGATFFGAPPERLVAKRGRRVATEALAGSAPRGETPDEDRSHANRLLESDKLRREHEFVVDAIRDQLEPLARTLEIEDRTIRKLATIQHLRTPIEATLDGDRHVLELVEALHPTPAVGGLPPDAAWATIRETEPFDRGWYAAPVGWFDADGDGEFAVGLRSGLATERRVALFAGSGIVADSDPDEEWDEVQLKFRPILDELR